MSLFDSLRKQKKAPVQRLIGVEHITQSSIQSQGGRYTVYFLTEPVNLAVLSRSNIQAKIIAMLNTLKALPEVELLCLGSREDFDGNKAALNQRLTQEDNDAVRRLLEKDLLFLDQIQIQVASAREFAFALRFRHEDDIPPAISRMEKLLGEQGFRARLAGKDDLKRLYAVYFAQNMTQLVLDDYDGERWASSIK
ncbi:hypothetical protein LJC34_06965 [Oscillospiraceae bacterium OttesenSCG-928-G22]|nr:hypothetical protein [Oscillospiraceae bacterium OttesenSCG-928-G22]